MSSLWSVWATDHFKKNQKQKTDSKNPKWRKGLDVNRNILAENEIKFFSGLNVEESVG